MRHDIPDIGNMSEQYPHLIFHNFKTRLGERVNESNMNSIFGSPTSFWVTVTIALCISSNFVFLKVDRYLPDFENY